MLATNYRISNTALGAVAELADFVTVLNDTLTAAWTAVQTGYEGTTTINAAVVYQGRNAETDLTSLTFRTTLVADSSVNAAAQVDTWFDAVTILLTTQNEYDTFVSCTAQATITLAQELIPVIP